MYIIHSVVKEEFENEIKSGYYGKNSLEKFGFVHCSDLDTYYLVAPNFKNENLDRLILLIDIDKVEKEIKWEDAEGVEFPHIYGLLNQSAIVGIYNHLWSVDKIWIPNEGLNEFAINGFERKINLR